MRGRTRITSSQRKDVKNLFKTGRTRNQIAQELGLQYGTVAYILAGARPGNGKQKEFLTFNEACDHLKVKPSWMRSAIFKRNIPHTKVGRLIRFSLPDLNKWLNDNSSEVGEAKIQRRESLKVECKQVETESSEPDYKQMYLKAVSMLIEHGLIEVEL